MFDTEDAARIDATLAAACDAESKIAHKFYQRLFELAPEMRGIFAGDLALHAPRLMGMLHAIPLAVEAPEATREVLREIGAEHLRMGVRVEHYDPMLRALLDALAKTAGTSWNGDAAAAWRRFLDRVRDEMIAGREVAS